MHRYSAAVLSLVSSIIMVIITIVYVCYTKNQADNSRESVNLMIKQIKTEKQPCILPDIIGSHGTAFNASNYVRIQAGLDIDLKNVGDAPAISVFTICECELQLSKDSKGRKIRLPAALLPYYVQAVPSDDTSKIHIHFETEEVKAIVNEISKCMALNWERIQTNPTRSHYTGAVIIITVLYRNVMGQWYQSVLRRELCWFAFDNPPEQTTHNLNENTIPPKEIEIDKGFRMVLSAPKYAPFNHKLVSESKAQRCLSKYSKDN